jgi:hypothetical protein
MTFTFALLLLFAGASIASAATDADGYNEVTIRPSDIPRDAPRFESYPAKRYFGKIAAPVFDGDPTTRMFRGQLKKWANASPNFAGRYILATWGCGSDCTQLAIIDTKTGKVTHPVDATTNVATNVHHELLEGGNTWHASGAIKFRPDSNLLVLIGMPGEDTDKRGISYFVWDGAKLTLVRFVKKPWYGRRK